MPMFPTKTLKNSNTLMARYPDDVRTLGVRLAGGVNYPAGTIVAEQNIAKRNEVQTLTIGGSPTGGTFTIVTTDGLSTGNLAYNANAATIQAALDALIGAGNVAVTGTGPFTFTFGGEYGNRNVGLLTTTAALTGGSSPTATIAKTTPGSAGPTGTAVAYADGGSSGAGVPRWVVMHDTVTNMRGMVVDEFGQEIGNSATVAYRGEFYCADLPNIAAVVAGSDLASLGRLTAGQATTDTGAIIALGIS